MIRFSQQRMAVEQFIIPTFDVCKPHAPLPLLILHGLHDTALHCIVAAGPAAALASAGWLWGVLHPSSHSLASCLVALAAVAADYGALSRDISRGRVRPGAQQQQQQQQQQQHSSVMRQLPLSLCTNFHVVQEVLPGSLSSPHCSDYAFALLVSVCAGEELEAAWHVRHKRAAQRLAVYCGDLQATPPLQPLLHAASCCSIAAGVSVDGQGLSGLLAPGIAGSWLGSSSSSSGPQLLLICAVHEPTDGSSNTAVAKAKQHEAAGLSRKQLLELFTGSGEEPGAAAAAALPVIAPAAVEAAAVTAVTLDAAGAAAGGKDRGSRRDSTGSSATVASSADMTVHVLDNGHSHAEALDSAAAAAAAATELQQQLQLIPRQGSTLAATPAAAGAVHDYVKRAAAVDEDPLALLEGLPLYGQQDHAQSAAALLDGSSSSSKQQRRLQLLDTLQLSLRAVYLLLVFAPFMLLGVPMLLLSWYLLSRAAAAQQRRSAGRREAKQLGSSSSSSNNTEAAGVAVISPLPVDSSDVHRSSSSKRSSWRDAITSSLTTARDVLSQPRALLSALLQQLLSLLTQVAALLDLLLVLLLGGHWAAGIGAWESAGLWLRRRAWRLLLFSSSAAGAAFIKWGQWSSARRDIFPEDFCDTLAALHDK
jgi:hypothetical protein